MTQRLFALLGGALFAAACRSGTEPTMGSEAGRYVARSLGSQALPARTDSSSSEYGVVLADTLELDGLGGARRAFALHRVSHATGTDETYHPVFSVRYRRTGRHLEVGSFTLCPANAVCVANDVGELKADALSLVTFLYGTGQTVTFARVP